MPTQIPSLALSVQLASSFVAFFYLPRVRQSNLSAIEIRLGIKGSFFCTQECFKAGCEWAANSFKLAMINLILMQG